MAFLGAVDWLLLVYHLGSIHSRLLEFLVYFGIRVFVSVLLFHVHLVVLLLPGDGAGQSGCLCFWILICGCVCPLIWRYVLLGVPVVFLAAVVYFLERTGLA